MQAGDWMNYTVDVAQPGSYTLTARNSYWGTTGGTFHVEADGVDATGPLQLGGGNVWQTLTKPGVQLNAGRHVLRVVCDSNGTDGYYMGSLDYLRLTADEDAGVVARWKFDEGTGSTASDSTGYGSTGTLGGSASWSSGVIGSNSLNFNGTSGNVGVSSSSSLSSVSNNFTISFWASPRSTHEIDPESTTGVAGVGAEVRLRPDRRGRLDRVGRGRLGGDERRERLRARRGLHACHARLSRGCVGLDARGGCIREPPAEALPQQPTGQDGRDESEVYRESHAVESGRQLLRLLRRAVGRRESL
jgi:hypothetical protein